MKANEAPKRIWINSPQDLPCGHIDNNSIEYTRTDVFIEKACKFLNKELYTRFSGNEHFVASSKAINLQEFIKNFKNYMLCQ